MLVLIKFLAALLVGACLSGPQPAQAQPTTLRILPFGDSLTDGLDVPGGYRIRLHGLLADLGYDVRFVGPYTNGPKSLPSRNHMGLPGATMNDVGADLAPAVRAYAPHVVLMLLGTNDVWYTHDTQALLEQYERVMLTAFIADPSIMFVVAMPPPAKLGPAYEARMEQFTYGVADIAFRYQALGWRVYLADHYQTDVEISDDGVHPTRAGYDRMAANWFCALTGFEP